MNSMGDAVGYQRTIRWGAVVICLCMGLLPNGVFGSGILRNGVGARSVSVAGADVGWAETPLGAFGANPAGFAQLEEPTLELGVGGGVGHGRFDNPSNSGARLSSDGVFPEAAFGMRLGQSPVRLTRGDNADLNGLLGSDALTDIVPLDWRDQFVFRAGVEFRLLKSVHLRGGYRYGGSPVPDGTLMPMTAAIFEHGIAAGVGYSRGAYRVDFGYQYDIPTSQSVGQSGLRSGEYDNSRVRVGMHLLALSMGVRF